MAIPKHLTTALERHVSEGNYERAAKLARELHIGADTKMERKVLEDFAGRHNLKIS